MLLKPLIAIILGSIIISSSNNNYPKYEFNRSISFMDTATSIQYADSLINENVLVYMDWLGTEAPTIYTSDLVLADILKEKYSIETFYEMGCIQYSSFFVIKEKMDSAIAVKHGKNFIKDLLKEAKKPADKRKWDK